MFEMVLNYSTQIVINEKIYNFWIFGFVLREHLILQINIIFRLINLLFIFFTLI